MNKQKNIKEPKMIKEQQKQNLGKDKQTEQFLHLLFHSDVTKKETFQPLARLLWKTPFPSIFIDKICSLNKKQMADAERKLKNLLDIDQLHEEKYCKIMKRLFQGFYKDIQIEREELQKKEQQHRHETKEKLKEPLEQQEHEFQRGKQQYNKKLGEKGEHLEEQVSQAGLRPKRPPVKQVKPKQGKFKKRPQQSINEQEEIERVESQPSKSSIRKYIKKAIEQQPRWWYDRILFVVGLVFGLALLFLTSTAKIKTTNNQSSVQVDKVTYYVAFFSGGSQILIIAIFYLWKLCKQKEWCIIGGKRFFIEHTKKIKEEDEEKQIRKIVKNISQEEYQKIMKK